MTECTACGQYFGGVTAFDKHRVGKHAYEWSVDHEDGRRCLDLEEYEEHDLVLNSRGTWSIATSLEKVRELRENRSS